MRPIPKERFALKWWIDEVLRTRESDLRGHMVALTYSKLGLLLDDILRGSDGLESCISQRRQPPPRDANWFNFATWATVTVTRNLAHERAPERADVVLPMGLRRRLTPMIVRERAANGQRISRALAWGQRLIFASVGFTMMDFAKAMETRHKATETRDDKFELSKETRDRILAVTTVDGESRVEELRHLDPIEEAFELYRLARLESDPGMRSRLILGANVFITAVEQDLVDDAVETVIGHVPQRVMQRADRGFARVAETWTGTPRQIVELQLPFRTAGARDLLDTAWSRLMTDQVLVMALPTETLRLGRDIPPRDPGKPFYPWMLRHLDREPNNPVEVGNVGRAVPCLISEIEGDVDKQTLLQKVVDVVRSFDRTRGGGRGSAAQDWRRFDDRMNWAVTLMRSRQADDTLFWPPYSVEDERRIRDGCLPVKGGNPNELEVLAPIDDARAFRRPDR